MKLLLLRLPIGDAVEPEVSLECGFHRSFSNTSTCRNSARQCLSPNLSSSRTRENQEKAVFRKGEMNEMLKAGRRVDRVNGWVKKNGSSPRTRTARRSGMR